MKRERLNISEAKSEYQKSLEKKVGELEDVPASLKGEKKPAEEKSQDGRTLQQKWYELKKKESERRDRQEIENRKKQAAKEEEKRVKKIQQAEAEKEKRVSGYKEKAAQSLKGIKTQQISKDDPEGTAYKKLIGNVGSAVGGVAGAVGSGLKAFAASREKIKRPEPKPQQNFVSSSPPPREPGQPGRPKKQERGGALAVRQAGGALTKPPSTSPVDKRRMLPGSTQGGTRVGQPVPGSRPQVPGSQKKAAIQAGTYKPIKSIQDEYSNWREELIVEQGLIIEVEKIKIKDKKKKKIIDIMRGENKVEINPKINDYFGYNEAYEDETFRQHSRETFSSHSPTEGRKRTASVLKLMKQMNADVEKPKKKKKKKTVAEECGCEKNDKKKDMMVALVKALVNAKKKKNSQLNNQIIGESSPAWQRKEGKNPEGGLNKAGIASYRKEHPGSKLSLAVTTEPSKLKKGSKKWKRRKSFCARMSGMPGPMKDEKGRPTRKALSLRKWNC